MKSRSYVVAILRALATSRGKPLTPSDLYKRISEQTDFSLIGGLKGPRPIESITMTLNELHAVGVVDSSGDGWLLKRPSGFDTAEVTPPVDTRSGAGDTGQPPIPPTTPNGDGQGGSGGIGEILLHPILFSIDEDEFNAAIDRAIVQF